MDKIKKIEKIKRRWEAAELALRDRGMVGKAGVIMRRIEGINAALEILNQPSNDVNAPVACKYDVTCFHYVQCGESGCEGCNVQPR